MSYEFVWGLFALKGHPPQSRNIHLIHEGFKFFPFAHDGKILTIDSSMWSLEKSSFGILEEKACNLWPNLSDIIDFVEERDSVGFKLVAFSDLSNAQTIDPDNPVSIVKIPTYLKEEFLSKFEFVGFDVVDKTGLSALVNIGFGSDDLPLVADLRVNKDGLVAIWEDAVKFAEAASQISPEHAPFFLLEIWCNTLRRDLDSDL